MKETAPNGWATRPLAAWSVRALIVAVPIGASVGTAWVVSRTLPHPMGTPGHLAWLLGVFTCSMVTFMIVERAARRFLPLAMLLRLALVFPDRAPSRFAMALRTGSPRRLQAWADREAGIGEAAGHQATIVVGLVSALGAHDRRTRGHSERVQALSDLMATELGLSDDAAQRLRWAALLHDIGKLEVPTEIINDPGHPDDEAMRIIRRHPLEGARITEPLASWLGEWRHGIDQHHERWDGAGYPFGLSGHEISLAGRIVSVTDAFETMTAVRAYKRAMSVPAARAEIVRCAGSHFDPEMVRSFLTISIGRLRWTTGVLAGLVELPLIGILPRAGTALVAVGALTVPAAISPPVRAEAVPATAAVSTPSPAVGVVSPPTMPPSSASTPPQPDAPPPPDAPTTQVVPTAEDLVNQLLAPLGVQLPPLSPLVPTLLDEVGAGSPLRTGGSSP